MDGYQFKPPDWRDAQVIKRDKVFRYGKPGILPEYRLFDEGSLLPGLMDPPDEFLKKIMFLTLMNLLIDQYKEEIQNGRQNEPNP